MCGIVGYVGKREAWPIIIKGLKLLEYRGYDSAGIALVNDQINVYKKAGKVDQLEKFAVHKDLHGTVGIGHTRWATHGEPTDSNAHPHRSGNHRFAIVHNGIIENYSTLKENLLSKGHVFESDTDTEVLIHLIEEIQKEGDFSLTEAVRLSLSQVAGAYAIVIVDRENPDQLVAARKGSPLVIGVGEHEYIIGSDTTPIIEHTKNIIYLKDNEIVTIDKSGLQIRTIDNELRHPVIEKLELQLEALEKAGYDHFMLKEIYEQPKSVRDCIRGRIKPNEGIIALGGLASHKEVLKNANRIIIIACGTSWHAGLVGEYLIENYARIPVEVEYASEFRYRNPVIHKNDIVIAISQSGETADTLAALELAKENGAIILGICNVIGSSITRMTDAGVYTHAGPEIGVASTKAFTAQVTVLTLIALYIAQLKNSIEEKKLLSLLKELDLVPELIERCLHTEEAAKRIAEELKETQSCLFLGRGLNFPVALEGALKLKEISYIHAAGYPAGEMKHGPIALIDEEMPVVVIATKNLTYEKVLSNIQEVKARKGIIIAVVTEGDKAVKDLADFVMEIPESNEIFSPLLATIPLQFLSYHVALLRGCNVDQPRNLAKSVTVE